ncbi:DUF4399 domain-containing protein [Isoalcanivorax beigongshangi]|uniref:DUF4399 domain-containing protein n=1 Tax=Isoalcanivorax beigongshangi TaxID=3238810 RepID=A0ABV4AJ91_9GAMM
MKRIVAPLSLLACAAMLGACSEPATPTTEASAAPSVTPTTVSLPRQSSTADARVYFVSPADGATLSNPVKLEFGLDGMQVAPAGDATPGTGHHHLLIDTPELPNMNQPLPANDKLIHFGGGQTEIELELAPGTHRLQLVLGDALHIPHQPPVVSEPITITVE